MLRKVWCMVLFLIISMGSSLLGAEEESIAREEAFAWYKQNFVLWKACHDEIKPELGKNIKRNKAYCQRAIASLEKLQEVFDQEKKAAIQS